MWRSAARRSVLARLRRDPASRYLAHAVLTAVVIEGALRIVPLSRLASAVGAPLDLQPSGDGENADPSTVLGPADGARLRASQIVLRRWPFGTRGPCLRHALVAGRLLRHRQPRIALGAGRDARGPLAHAWLMVDGISLDPGATSWTPLRRPGSS